MFNAVTSLFNGNGAEGGAAPAEQQAASSTTAQEGGAAGGNISAAVAEDGTPKTDVNEALKVSFALREECIRGTDVECTARVARALRVS